VAVDVGGGNVDAALEGRGEGEEAAERAAGRLTRNAVDYADERRSSGAGGHDRVGIAVGSKVAGGDPHPALEGRFVGQGSDGGITGLGVVPADHRGVSDP